MKCSVCQKNIYDFMENEIDDSNLNDLIKEHLEECTNCKELYNQKLKEKEALRSEFYNPALKFTNENEVISSINLNYYNNSFAKKTNFHLRKFKIRYISCVLFILLAIYLTPTILTNKSYFINLLHSKNNTSPVTNTENIIRSDDYFKNKITEFSGVEPEKISKLENETAEGKNIRVFSDNVNYYYFYDNGAFQGIRAINPINHKLENEHSNDELRKDAVNILKKLKKDNFIFSKDLNSTSDSPDHQLYFIEKDSNNINTGSYIYITLWSDGTIINLSEHDEPKLSPETKINISKDKALKIIFKLMSNNINLNKDKNLSADIKNSKLSPDKYLIERNVCNGIPVWEFTLKDPEGRDDYDLFKCTISAIDGHIMYKGGSTQ